MMALLVLAGVFAAPSPLELDQVLAEVGRRAPEVKVREADVDVSRAQVGVAGAWEDPSITVMAESLPLPGGAAEDPAMITYRFGQPLNIFGRRELAKSQARAVVEGRQALLARSAWDARARAVMLFFELWMNSEMATLLDEQIRLLERMRDAGLARVRAGLDMGHHDVLRAEAEIERARARRITLDEEWVAMSAMLNALRGHPQDEAIGAVVLPKRVELPPLATLLGAVGLSPEVAGARAMGREARAGLGLARRMYLPMVVVEGEYEQRLDGMPDGFGVSLMISVPLWWRDRQRNEVSMANAMVRRADREVEAMETMAEAEVRMAWSQARAAERKLAALEDTVLPRLGEAVASAEAAYGAGRGEFIALLDAVMALLDVRMERIETIVDVEVTRFELARVLGRPLAAVTP